MRSDSDSVHASDLDYLGVRSVSAFNSPNIARSVKSCQDPSEYRIDSNENWVAHQNNQAQGKDERVDENCQRREGGEPSYAQQNEGYVESNDNSFEDSYELKNLQGDQRSKMLGIQAVGVFILDKLGSLLLDLEKDSDNKSLQKEGEDESSGDNKGDQITNLAKDDKKSSPAEDANRVEEDVIITIDELVR